MKLKVQLTLFVLASFPCSLPAAVQDIRNSIPEKIINPVTIEIDNNKITFVAKKTSLQTALQLITKHYPIKFKIIGQLSSNKRDWNIKNEPLNKAVDRILREYSKVMYFKSANNSIKHQLFKVDIISEKINVGSNNIRQVYSSTNTFSNTPAQEDHDFQQVDRLQGLTDSITIHQLSEGLEKNRSSHARIRAAILLEEIGTKKAKMAVESALGDQDIEVRKQVVDLLSTRDDFRSALLLGQVIHGDPAAQIRLAALHKLAAHNNEISNVFVHAALNDKDTRVMEAAKILTINLNYDIN